jgi:hypothetical protein
MSHLCKIYKRFSKEELVSYVVIPVILGILALLIRAPGLGKWCITIDEFYYSQPVAFILEKGIPELPGGGYYTRGILLQYLTVLPVMVFEKWEFAIRLLPLMFGLLTIPLFYILCKLFLPTKSSLFASIIILFSSWHIEFSRFARFYAPFQFLFLLFLFLFYKGYCNNQRKYQTLSWLIAFLSIFIYEGAIFLPLIMFLGLLIKDPAINVKKRNIELFLVASLLLCCNYLINNYDWWFLKVNNALPPFLSSSIATSDSNSLMEFPSMDLLIYTFSHWESTIFYSLLLLFAVIIYITQHKKSNSIILNTAIVIALVLSLLHLYVLSIFIFAILFLGRDDIKIYFLEHKILWITYYIVTLLYSVIIIFFSGNLNKILYYVIGYPPIKKTIILPLFENVPFWGCFIFFPFLISIFHNVFVKRKQSINFILIVILSIIMIMPIIKTLWMTTRYIYFFYPLFIIILYFEINSLMEWIINKYDKYLMAGFINIIAFLPLLIFICSEDFNLYHVLNVSSKETNFRMGEYEKLSNHWYARVDLENPIKYVNDLYIDGDIVVLDDVIMSRYIKIPYVNYVDIEDDVRFPYHSRNEGRIEKWSGRALLFDMDALTELVPKNNNNSLWLVSSLVGNFIGTSFVQKYHTPPEIAKKYNLSVELKYTGIDKRIGVWQFQNNKKKTL